MGPGVEWQIVNRNVTRRDLLAGGSVAVLGSIAGCSAMTPFVGTRLEETRTISTTDVNRLTARTALGDLTVSGTDRNDVRARVVKQSSSARTDLSKLQFVAERVDDELLLRSEWTGEPQTFDSRPSMDIELAMPRSLRVDQLATNTGDVEVSDVSGDSTVRSDTGDLTVERADGLIHASSQTGDVRIRSPAGIDAVRCETGDVHVDVPAIDGPTEITSSVGDIAAALGPELDAELTARTETGSISTEEFDVQDDQYAGARVDGTLGGGGPSLTIETDTGDVELSRLD